MTLPSTSLFFQEGSSDKVYVARIVEDQGAYTVQVEWGRRGSSLNKGNKALRVPLAEAQKVYDRLVREKTGKGYQEMTEEVRPAAVAPPEGQGSGSRVTGRRAKVGFSAQLLNPIEDHELEKFLADERLLAQQKLDGQRVLAHVKVEERRVSILATNRNGQETAVSISGLDYLPDGTVVDGELVPTKNGEAYWLFDVLKLGEDDVSTLGYEERWSLLESDIEPGLTGSARVLAVAIGKKKKRALFETLEAQGAEGIVFKDRSAPYKAGRPASGGTQRKYKFQKSADVVLLSNAGNAYQMAVFDQGDWLEVGRVFAGTTNTSRKQIDELLRNGSTPVAEVRYLYATRDEQLYQPVFVRLREDKDPNDCVRDQLVGTNRDVVDEG
ncbi:MAG: WGR domain-containing protein [Deltaproteobacteria bacterium]|nr:WGR domain-containing protein [Deltaproteobacteria bacterium]